MQTLSLSTEISVKSVRFEALFSTQSWLEALLKKMFFRRAIRLCPGYQGDFWEGRVLSNGIFYAVPTFQQQYRVFVEDNGFEGIMSAEAFGITVTLFSLYELADFSEQDDDIKAFHALYGYARGHSEAKKILAAID
ncbi:antirestriction protein [Photorhabdus namnaonensis]|uniref:Antirestriction protein KlcA n=1 Tax=Photorhabdus namnaonensis TaxID=1851568 RepID=A0A1B8YF28_9GAMM|nr:antirestriction protein [Photorhabdus namnaonensis]OCA53774.1 Antirestriction protein KlcA [Photorhabdus namnaonensis]